MGAAQTVCLAFDKLMLPGTLQAALPVTAVRDQDGAEVSSAAAVAVAYTLSPSLLAVAPAVDWASNTVYRVALSTLAYDQDGLPLGAPSSFTFLTRLDPARPNTVTAAAPGDPPARLALAAGALPGPGHVEINPWALGSPEFVPPAVLSAANAKLAAAGGGLARVHAVYEADYFTVDGARASPAFSPGAAVLSVPYADADGDGLLDGAGPPARVAALALYRLDEERSLWVRLPGSTASGGWVSAPLPHLSAYALASAEDVSVARAYAFPVPFRPNGPAAGIGPGRTGTAAAGITFADLPSRATIEVFNVRGERVWRGEESDGDGSLAWNVRNSEGRPVVSGVYFYLVRNPSGDVKTGKLAVIR
jgi:hypothetical protein